MAAGVNKAILIGNLGRDPELRHTQSGQPVCDFSIATTESWSRKDGSGREEKTEWHRIVAWGRTAELCAQYLSKGRTVYIEGRLQTREWENREGQKQRSTEVVAQTVQFLGGPRGSGGGSSRDSGGGDFGGGGGGSRDSGGDYGGGDDFGEDGRVSASRDSGGEHSGRLVAGSTSISALACNPGRNFMPQEQPKTVLKSLDIPPRAREAASRANDTKKKLVHAGGRYATGAATGAAAAAGTMGIAAAVGTASTGTAISALSGAAATKATLAWLGGGAIAAGGFGIAGGAIVLGAIGIGAGILGKKIYRHLASGRKE